MRIGNFALTGLCLVVGVLIGYVAGQYGKPVQEGTGEASTPIAGPGDGMRRPPKPVAGEATLADVLAAIPIPEAEAGEGEITGVVKLRSGEPLEGVLIRATPGPTSS